MSFQDGEIDLKLLSKVLAPEQEFKEVSEILVNISWEVPLKTRPAVCWASGEVATRISQVIKIYDVYINTLQSPFLFTLPPSFPLLSFLALQMFFYRLSLLIHFALQENVIWDWDCLFAEVSSELKMEQDQGESPE